MTPSKENSRVGYVIPFIIANEINTILYLCDFTSFFVLCSESSTVIRGSTPINENIFTIAMNN